jgi:hypothetical protein
LGSATRFLREHVSMTGNDLTGYERGWAARNFVYD